MTSHPVGSKINYAAERVDFRKLSSRKQYIAIELIFQQDGTPFN